MKRILWSVFLTVVCVLLTVECVAGSNSISSFTVKSWNTKSNSWAEDTNIFPRNDVRLECTTAETSQVNELRIKRADGFPLSIYNAKDIQRNAQSLVVILKTVECTQMGTYVCKNGQGDRKTVDFGIHDCPPLPCKDQSTDITLYASVDETKQFSVCVEAFSDVTSFGFNGKQADFDKEDEFLLDVKCTKAKSEYVFSTYNISCTIKVGGDINYRVHDFSIFNGAAQNQKVSFAVQIKKPGPPECPTSIICTNPGRDSVTLSWQPVNNRGAKQPVRYTVFCTSNDAEWRQLYNKITVTVQDTQATVTHLQADTVYELRVASANEYSQVIDENTCDNKVEVKTEQDPTTTTQTGLWLLIDNDNNTNSSDEVDTSIIVVIIFIAILVVTMIVLGIYFRSRLKRHNCQPWTRARPTDREGHHMPQVSLMLVMKE